MVAGVDGLGDQLRVARHSLPAGFFGEGWRLVTKDDHNFVFDVDAGVVVVMEFVGGDAVAGEDYGRVN